MSEINDYGLSYFSRDDFRIKDGALAIRHKGGYTPIIDIISHLREEGFKGPLLLRFPHLIKGQIERLFLAFNKARAEHDYKGSFKALFPLKVNPMPHFLKELARYAEGIPYGLEAGSKPELILAMCYTKVGSPITVNGFKDAEMISLGFIAASMGHDITITIEGINELRAIIELTKEFVPPYPKVGIRIRLHSTCDGPFAKSGGINAKFGLSSVELLEAMALLKEHSLLKNFTMLHFHIGSLMRDISPLKKALREAGNIYVELRKMGAKNLRAVNIGGGLAIEYSQHEENATCNYSLDEFSADVIYVLKDIAMTKGEAEPDVFTESGRFIAAYHSLLITPVLSLLSRECDINALNLHENNPPLITELIDLHTNINAKNAIEYLHDALDHMESLLTLFDLGYISLIDRSNTEILVQLIVRRVIEELGTKDLRLRRKIEAELVERYLLNCSFFQSLPNYWGLGQHFPVMPITHLDEPPRRSASLWDITCDSDGEISFDTSAPLYLHDVDVDKEEYNLAFFLTGAYQEVLGMKHNLFTHPSEINIGFDEEGFVIQGHLEARNILGVLQDINHDVAEIERILKSNIDTACGKKTKMAKKLLGKLYVMLSENCYLKSV